MLGYALKVDLLRDGQLISSEIFTKTPIIVGRDSDLTDLVLLEENVSRKHLSIHYNQQSILLEDNQSKNGTWLNGKRILKSFYRPEDELVIGQFTLKLSVVLPQTMQAGTPQRDEGTAPGLDPSSSVRTGEVFSHAPPIRDVFSPALLGDQGSRSTRGASGPALSAYADLSSSSSALPAEDTASSHDDDDEAHFQPSYSLVEKLANAMPPSPGIAGEQNYSPPYVEVVAVMDDKIVDYQVLQWQRPQFSARFTQASDFQSPSLAQVALAPKGGCILSCEADSAGEVWQDGRRSPLQAVLSQHGKHLDAQLQIADVAKIAWDRGYFLVRHIPLHKEILEQSLYRRDKGSTLSVLWVAFISLLLHGLVAGLLSFLTSPKPSHAPHEEFAVAVKQEPVLEEPPPKPEPEPEPEPPAPPEPPKKKKMVAKKRPMLRPRPTPTPPTPAPPKPSEAGVLGLLNKKGMTQAPGAASAVAALTNLSSVKSPGATRGFKVTGLVGKMPKGAGISLGGGSGVVTKGGANAIKGGAGILADRHDRSVRGIVQKDLRALEAGGEGRLDRRLIEQVVNEHSSEIQRCYERELLKNTNLGGKVEVEWTISTAGTVSSIRQKRTSIESPALIQCMLSAIRKWQFPKPQGGPVIVSFPFQFSGVDF